jgi:hypothetical protein
METLIEAIRVGLLPDATDEAKHQGALACQTILTALETKEGQPPAEPTPEARPTTIDPKEVSAIVGALRELPPEQLLDLAIARLRAALPPNVTAPPVAPIRFQLVPVAQLASTGKEGGS